MDLQLSDEHADLDIEVDRTQGCISALTSLRQRHPELTQLKIILSIGGGGQGSANFARVASDHTTRHIFATSAKDLVDQYGFDGVDSMSTTDPGGSLYANFKKSIGNILQIGKRAPITSTYLPLLEAFSQAQDLR